jgi:CHAD domain-containing protein
MWTTTTPASLLVDQVLTLRNCLPGVHDGDADCIHDARVATRRIRELLRSAGSSEPANDLRERFRKIGRALGRVRDTDVRLALLTRLESRLPPAAPALVRLRYEKSRRRLELMRALVKDLERFEMMRLVDSVAAHRRTAAVFFDRSKANAWRRVLRQTIHSRGRRAADALEHATGVYFPNRAHKARIALKKLRYAIEIANDARAADLSSVLRDLRKSQDDLGEIHDRQMLLDELPSRSGDDEPVMTVILRESLEAEIARLHGRYLSRRQRLFEIARDAQSIGGAYRWRLPALGAAGALALSSGAYLVQRRLR